MGRQPKSSSTYYEQHIYLVERRENVIRKLHFSDGSMTHCSHPDAEPGNTLFS